MHVPVGDVGGLPGEHAATSILRALSEHIDGHAPNVRDEVLEAVVDEDAAVRAACAAAAERHFRQAAGGVHDGSAPRVRRALEASNGPARRRLLDTTLARTHAALREAAENAVEVGLAHHRGLALD